MIKVSITLPNSVQITLESDAENVHEIVGAVLRDLPRELLSASFTGLSNPSDVNAPDWMERDQAIISQLSDVLSRLQTLLEAQNTARPSLLEEVAQANGAANSPPESLTPTPLPESSIPENSSSPASGTFSNHQDAATTFPTKANEASFIQFCRSVNPLGDMRRVVVAAEGADRFLRTDGRADGVDAEELSRLFDLAGWTQPHSFTQTLRNAARSKFRWIERMPGRNGRYWVTERGKEIARQG